MFKFARLCYHLRFVDMTKNSAAAIGSKIKALRESKNILAEDMIERSGLDKEFYNLLEDDKVVPVLGDLIKITRVLGVRLGTLLDDYNDEGPVISRIDECDDANAVPRSKKGDTGVYEYHSLSAGKGNRHMETYSVTLKPADGGEKNLSDHEGEEFVYVVDGEVEMIYGKEKYLLKKGDTIYFDSIVPHHIGSASEEKPAKLMVVIYIPA